MFKNMRIVIIFDMFFYPSFEMTTSFANTARPTESNSSKIKIYIIKLCIILLNVLNIQTNEL